MRRRDFILGIAGSAAAWPLAARGQQPAKVLTIGYLGSSTASAETQRTAAFVLRLRELGWTDGRNVAIEYHWAEGRAERFTEIAAEFVRLKVDIIVAEGTAAAAAAKQATSTIPIVFPVATDPIGNALVASLARPGGNITGLSAQHADLSGKRLELLREVVPDLRRLAVLANGDSPGPMLEMAEVQAGARTLGLDAVPFAIRKAEDIVQAFTVFNGRADALYVCADPLVTTNLRWTATDDVWTSGER